MTTTIKTNTITREYRTRLYIVLDGHTIKVYRYSAEATAHLLRRYGC
jgi:hypothetical protein